MKEESFVPGSLRRDALDEKLQKGAPCYNETILKLLENDNFCDADVLAEMEAGPRRKLDVAFGSVIRQTKSHLNKTVYSISKELHKLEMIQQLTKEDLPAPDEYEIDSGDWKMKKNIRETISLLSVKSEMKRVVDKLVAQNTAYLESDLQERFIEYFLQEELGNTTQVRENMNATNECLANLSAIAMNLQEHIDHIPLSKTIFDLAIFSGSCAFCMNKLSSLQKDAAKFETEVGKQSQGSLTVIRKIEDSCVEFNDVRATWKAQLAEPCTFLP